ncbi:hypothetical protein YC2023_038345 [Brassica napus]
MDKMKKRTTSRWSIWMHLPDNKTVEERVTRRPPRLRSPDDACTRVKRWPLSSTSSREETRRSSAVGREKTLNNHRIYGSEKSTIDINQSRNLRLF